MTETKPIRILGVGNVLCTDDGLGPYAIKVLEAQFEFADPVEVMDLGTPGLDFTPYLSDTRMVIVLDTVGYTGDLVSLVFLAAPRGLHHALRGPVCDSIPECLPVVCRLAVLARRLCLVDGKLELAGC